jgi:hypothetical protein
MSRGLGRVQRDILEYLPSPPPDGWTPCEAGYYYEDDGWLSIHQLALFAGVRFDEDGYPVGDRPVNERLTEYGQEIEQILSPHEYVVEGPHWASTRVATYRPRIVSVQRAVRGLAAAGLVEVVHGWRGQKSLVRKPDRPA